MSNVLSKQITVYQKKVNLEKHLTILYLYGVKFGK